MSTLFTKEQREFARSLSPKQWGVLSVLAEYPLHMSASERCDRELYALVQNDLVRCFTTVPGTWAMWGWQASEAGKALVKRRRKGTL